MIGVQAGPLAPPVGRKSRIFDATPLILSVGMMLPENAVRHGWPPTTWVVAGSKICPRKTWLPSQGLICPVSAPSNAEKFPERSSAVGRVDTAEVPGRFRYCSHEKKKKLRPLPL